MPETALREHRTVDVDELAGAIFVEVVRAVVDSHEHLVDALTCRGEPLTEAQRLELEAASLIFVGPLETTIAATIAGLA